MDCARSMYVLLLLLGLYGRYPCPLCAGSEVLIHRGSGLGMEASTRPPSQSPKAEQVAWHVRGMSSTLSESWTRRGKWQVPYCRWCGVVVLRNRRDEKKEIGIEKLGDDALPRAGGRHVPGGGVIKRKTRVPAHVEDDAVHCYSRLHCRQFHGDDLWFHGKGPDGFGEMETMKRIVEVAAAKQREKKRRLQVEDGKGSKSSYPEFSHPGGARACVRPKRASPVSRRG